MTVCKLPSPPDAPPRLARRLDLKIYPREILPYALLYFTGSDYYNRSLRNFVNKAGWSLSDHGLCRVNRESTHLKGKQLKEMVLRGRSVAAANEADVLRAIGAPWRPPHEREASK